MTNPDSGLVVPKHGHGRIKRGGNHGNNCGGREKSKVRDRLAKLRDDTLDELQEKLKVGDLSDSDAIKLASLAAKYTLRAVAYDEDLIDELWDATEAALLDHPELVENVKQAWIPVLAQRLMAGG